MLRCEAVVPARSKDQWARRCWATKNLRRYGKRVLCKIHGSMHDSGKKIEFSKERDGAPDYY